MGRGQWAFRAVTVNRITCPARAGHDAFLTKAPPSSGGAGLQPSGGKCFGDREIDNRLGDFVDVIRPSVQRDVQNDLDHLRIIVACQFDRTQIIVTDMAARLGDFGRKLHGGICLWIAGVAVPIGKDFGIIQFGKGLAQVGVRRQTIGATVDFGHGKGNAFTRGSRQAALSQCPDRPR
jgi:hypothetical protein